jgi:hypothetical protein
MKVELKGAEFRHRHGTCAHALPPDACINVREELNPLGDPASWKLEDRARRELVISVTLTEAIRSRTFCDGGAGRSSAALEEVAFIERIVRPGAIEPQRTPARPPRW